MVTKTIKMIIAAPGMWLTEAGEVEERTFCGRVLNVKDVRAWTEWTDAQKEAWEREHVPTG